MTNPSRILIIDDDPIVIQMASQNLQLEGHEVLLAGDGREGLRVVFEERPDLVILDVMMPGGLDGFETCQRIRELTDVPIIMLTGRKDEADIVRGLELGADDYMVKPFNVGELNARVGAALRRIQIQGGPATSTATVYEDDYLKLDLPTRTVEVDGEKIKLSATEFNLLAYLFKHSNRVLESTEILQAVWGAEYRDEIAYIRVYVSHLRQKIERDPTKPIYIQTERQIGYRFIRRDSK